MEVTLCKITYYSMSIDDRRWSHIGSLSYTNTSMLMNNSSKIEISFFNRNEVVRKTNLYKYDEILFRTASESIKNFLAIDTKHKKVVVRYCYDLEVNDIWK